MKKILLVEDHASIVRGLTYLLEKQYQVVVATSKKEALVCLNQRFDLIILDVMLGDGDGFSIAELVEDVPIIFLTARDDEEDVVLGLSLGEDYMVKPFRNQELLARVQKVLKRNEKDIIECGALYIEKETCKVYFAGTLVLLSSQEYKILEFLCNNKKQVVTRERLLEVIWDNYENYVNDNTLTVAIKRIRAKIHPEIIKTIKGIGYMINEEKFLSC